ncbi:MAG TPA: NADPH-dependent FMN reductase [Micromonosporaceae bacterium]|jgi:NAD(P)H-dependent FMN reductase
MRILLISASTRSASTNSAALRAMHEHRPAGIDTVWYEDQDEDETGLASLPAFNPDDEDDLPPAVVTLRATIDSADAVLFCTPEYAGSLPGSFKNLLDWTVRGGNLYGKPVAYVSVAAQGRGEGAEANLRSVLGYVGATLIADACARVFVDREAVGPDGRVTDRPTRDQLVAALVHLAEAAATATAPSQ